MPLSNALRMQWMAFNSETHTNTVTVDVDHAEWEEMLERARVGYNCPIDPITLVPISLEIAIRRDDVHLTDHGH